MATLNVFFRDIPCARLTEEAAGALRFEYLESWIEEQGFPISVRLPVSAQGFGHEQSAPFIASFLPEGNTLRRRLEKWLHVDTAYDFGLLSAIGRESAGALSFWPEDEEPITTPRYRELSDIEFDDWKEYAHELPLQFSGGPVRLSLAGVQSKTALYFDEHNQPWLPEDGAATSHILKPRIAGWQPSSTFVELTTMRIAQSVLGTDRVPDVDLWRNCYRIRRYDRPRKGQGVSRLHQEDFCLALGRMPNQKYEAGSPRERLLKPCFDLIDNLGERGMIRSPAVERMRLLDQVIVNLLLHNADAHLKNYALLYKKDGAMEIAPLYDCLCTHGLVFESGRAGGWAQGEGQAVHTLNLSLGIGSAEQIDQVGVDDWESFADECGFTKAFVRRRVRTLAEQIHQNLQPTVEAVIESHLAAEQAAIQIVAGVNRQVESAARM